MNNYKGQVWEFGEQVSFLPHKDNKENTDKSEFLKRKYYFSSSSGGEKRKKNSEPVKFPLSK